ncbi:hypothetical protein IWX78_002384 [Mycetocola sp. CAN_C7]|uniref:hypothetical protein n=1 Tax=Mycetocola sp. CAN_C7 TaxID=2787724 RepID=UPI0018CA1CAD
MTESTPTSAPSPAAKKTRRSLMWAGVVVTGVLILGGGVAYSLANQPEPPSAAAEAAPGVKPKPTQTPTVTEPLIVPITQPTDCLDIYSQEFLQSQGVDQLNLPEMEGVGLSRYDSIETIRMSLPGIDCQWGPPTEGGMATAVNTTTPETKTALMTAATAEGFICLDHGEPFHSVCSISVGPSTEEGADGWSIYEELYFRDSLVVSTWRASISGTMQNSTQPVYQTLWP